MTDTMDGADVVGHWKERVREMTHLAEDASAERDLAMYWADRHGVALKEIAHLALLDPAEAARILTVYKNDPDTESLPHGPDWVRVYRHDGWGILG